MIPADILLHAWQIAEQERHETPRVIDVRAAIATIIKREPPLDEVRRELEAIGVTCAPECPTCGR